MFWAALSVFNFSETEQLLQCRCINNISQSLAGTSQALRIKQAWIWEAIPDTVHHPGLGQGASGVAELSPHQSLLLPGESTGLSSLHHGMLQLSK